MISVHSAVKLLMEETLQLVIGLKGGSKMVQQLRDCSKVVLNILVYTELAMLTVAM